MMRRGREMAGWRPPSVPPLSGSPPYRVCVGGLFFSLSLSLKKRFVAHGSARARGRSRCWQQRAINQGSARAVQAKLKNARERDNGEPRQIGSCIQPANLRLADRILTPYSVPAGGTQSFWGREEKKEVAEIKSGQRTSRTAEASAEEFGMALFRNLLHIGVPRWPGTFIQAAHPSRGRRIRRIRTIRGY